MNTYDKSGKPERGRADFARLSATTEREKAAIADEELAKLALNRDALEFRAVRLLPLPDVKKIRTSLEMTQSDFAERFGLRLRTIQQWEQGRTVPDLPAQILLRTIEYDPDAVSAALWLAINTQSRRDKKPSISIKITSVKDSNVSSSPPPSRVSRDNDKPLMILRDPNEKNRLVS